jgi:hypothetical protein
LRKSLIWISLALGCFAGGAAEADELIGGVYAHDVDTPLNLRGIEPGVDFQIGWRGDRIGALRVIGAPSPYAFAALNSAGETHYAAAGISWKIGRSLFLRPGIGLAVHSGPVRFDPAQPRRSLGSRVLFEPELGIGYQVNDRLSVEASLVHMSHATLFGNQNPGIDNIGVRIGYKLR